MNSPQEIPYDSSLTQSRSLTASGACWKSIVDAQGGEQTVEEGYLPPELWIQVFARLPVKSLLKFRCVSQEWRSLIDSPDFVSTHLTCYNSNGDHNNKLLLIEFPLWEKDRWTVLDSYTFTKSIVFLGKYLYDCSCASDYINGLLLIIKKGGRCSLWNPSIRKFMELPPCPIFPRDEDDELHEMSHAHYGLGFDSSNDDYKVVVIAYPSPEDDAEAQVASLVGVYSLKTGCWKTITDGTPTLECSGPQVFVEGAINWLAGSDTYRIDGIYCKIASFDVGCEVFNYMNLPNGDELRDRITTYLGVLDDSLVLLDVYLDVYVNLWIMENYGVSESWRRRYTINNLDCFDFLYLKNDGELLFMRDGVRSYNVKTQKLKDVDRTYRYQLDFVHTYVESLVLFNKVNGEAVGFSGEKEN